MMREAELPEEQRASHLELELWVYLGLVTAEALKGAKP